MTYQWDPQVARLIREAGPSALIVDFGAGGRRAAPHVQTVDFTKYPDTDYVVVLSADETPV